MQEAIDRLGDRFGVTIEAKESRLTQTDVRLKGVQVSHEEWGSELQIDKLHFVGAHYRSGDLLHANGLAIYGLHSALDADNRLSLGALYLDAEDIEGLFMMLKSDWANWNNLITLAGVSRIEAKELVLLLEGFEVTLDRFRLDGVAIKQGLLEQARYRGENLLLPAALFEEPGFEPLSEMGYAHLTISWEDLTRFEGEQMLHAKGRTLITIEEFAQLTMHLDLMDLPRDFMVLLAREDLSNQEMMAVMQIRLAAAMLDYQDKGFLSKLYGWLAREAQMEQAEFAQMLAEEIAHDLSDPQVLSKPDIEALKQFIRHPGRIRITAEPSEGVTFMEAAMLSAMNWPMLLERLQVHLEVEPAKP